MICQEFSYVAMLLFSVPEKDYDGTESCTLMKWNRILPLLDKVAHRNFERRCLNYVHDFFTKEHVAPSIHMFFAWFVPQLCQALDKNANIKKPKNDGGIEPYEEADCQSLQSHYQLGCLYAPADVNGLTEQWIRLIQLKSWQDVAAESLGAIYTGKTFSDVRSEAEKTLANLDNSDSDLSIWEHTETPESVMAAYDEQLRVFARSKPVKTGYGNIDFAYRGLRPGDFMTILGSSSHGKSTLAVNIALNALYNAHSGAYVTLEMTKKELQYRLYCMHSAHIKFRDIHSRITFLDLANGELTPDQRDFLRDFVVKDFHALPGRLTILDSSMAGMTLPEVEHALEGLDNDQDPFQYFVLDSPNLLDIVKVKGLPDFKQIGVLYQGIKRICDSYKDKGISCIAPVQANREGARMAEKNNGFYSADFAFADSQDIYRSCSQSVAISSFDWQRDECQCMIHGLKARWGKTPSGWSFDVCDATGRITDAGIPPQPKPKGSTVVEDGDSYATRVKKAKACAATPAKPLPPTPMPKFNL